MTGLPLACLYFGDFYPHGFCYQWDKNLVWLHVTSDSAIALSYFAIPFILLWFIRQRRDLPFNWMFALFAVFILACGMTHLLEVWNLWHAQYWLAGAVKALTASASVSTCVLLARLVPEALRLPSNRQWTEANSALQDQLRERSELERDLRRSESLYRETAELLNVTHDAIFVRNQNDEIVFWNLAAERLYGWTKEEVLGKNSHSLLQTEFPYALEQIQAQLLAKGEWEGELVHRRQDGTKIIDLSRWAIRTDHQGHPIATLESNRDITVRKQAERQLASLLEGAPDALVIANKDGLIHTVNAQTEKLFGYSRDEIVGQTVETLIPQRFREQHALNRQNYCASPHTRPMANGLDLYGRRKDGSEFPVEVSLSPIELPEGTLISSAIRDVTQRKQAEKTLHEQEEKLRLFVSGVTDYAVLMLDIGGNVVSWNSGAERINGYTADEIIGRHFSQFYPNEDLMLGKPAAALRAAIKHGRFEDEGWRVHKSGNRFWADVVITALYDRSGQLAGFGKVTRDMSKRKEIEDRLRGQSMQLAEVNNKLIESNKELEAFSYSVSHDLRAPLRSIDGFSLALLEDCSSQLNEVGKDHLNRVRAATQRMGLLIDDLLSLSRITRSQMHLAPVDISELVGTIVVGLEKAHPGRNVQCKIEDGLTAKVDQGLLRVALENLLSNAWKFTSKIPEAHIEFGQAQSNGISAYYVRDDGAGFDPRYAGRLFGAFQRLHTASEFPGTGIGLATVMRIVRRHGGHLWAESQIGQGATFYFTLVSEPEEGK